MKDQFNNFITSGINFSEDEEHLKARYQTLNIGLVLTMIALLFGIIGNIIRDVEGFIAVESAIIVMDIFLILAMRKFHKAFEYIVFVMIFQFTLLFIFLIYSSDATSMKYAWVFNYPMILLYLENIRKSSYWMLFLILMIISAPFNPYISTDFTFYQVCYISAVLIIINAIMFFYQLKMSEANNKILEQQKLLQNFNSNLEVQVKEKTEALQELNESLEIKVKEKLEEIIKRDKILEAQSKQAVMGEMISMIAHQWRQPLSTITLQISHMQFKKLLGQELDEEETDKTLTKISDTIVYLSDTIDDFLNYFNPDKEADEIDLKELLQKAINLALPKAKKDDVQIILELNEDIDIVTYINELVQIILNLLNNAVDALVESKKVKLIIKISAQIQNEHVIINVIDNANGIPQKNLTHIFEPYFSTKGKNGTGLGLYMSQMIVEKQLEGTLNVSSSSNGTIFTINIPSHI